MRYPLKMMIYLYMMDMER